MSDIRLTVDQQSAVSARNPELLVSAAAGSGKTAVLIERILSLLREGYSLDRMLVCTFTHAAAAEMRERLEESLGKAGVQDAALRRQGELVETAQISTLHAFCQKLLREFFEAAEIDPLAALCDEGTRMRLKRAALEACLDESYERAAEDAEIAAFLSKCSQEEAAAILDTLYDFLMSLPRPFDWLEGHARHWYAEADLREGPLAETLLADCRPILDGALALLEEALTLCESPDCRDSYARAIAGDGELLRALEAAAEKGLAPLMAAMGELRFQRFPTLKRLEPEEQALKEALKALRARYQKCAKALTDRLPGNPGEALRDLNAMGPALRGLAKMARLFHETFQERKNERGLIDFSDQEHLALAILEKPELRRIIARRFDAVFVDEYQDISAIQEAILCGLRREAPEPGGKASLFFYVGDVKQSIYRFRQADPTLFMEKLQAFEKRADAPRRKIILGENFRSRSGVLEAVNRVFRHVMRPEVTELAYDRDAWLNPGQPSRDDPAMELHVLEGGGRRAGERIAREAALIAREILRRAGREKRDWAGNPAGRWQYRDMVVLLPAAKGVADVVAKTLSAAGIPVYTEGAGEGMESPEIRQALAHLKLLDNERDDLSLLAVLKGPVYAMTEAELARVRLCLPQREASFREALAAAADSADPALAARCRDILDSLTRERFLQRAMPLDEYLWGFLSRSGLFGFYGAQPGGRLRQANLRMLCSRAGEQLRQRGGALRDFLELAEKGVAGHESPSVLSPWEDAVRVMTIHKSKGLEFPLVFVMGLGSSLLRKGSPPPVALHSGLGVGLKYVNEIARAKRSTLLGNAIDLRHRAEERAERARLLYVALTRAKEQFIAIGTGEKALLSRPEPAAAHGGAYAVWEAKSLLEWLCQCVDDADEILAFDGSDFSTFPLWETEGETQFSTVPTCFPQKTGVWRVVFHIDAEESRLCDDVESGRIGSDSGTDDAHAARLGALLESLQTGEPAFPAPADKDPIAPALTLTHQPLKLGVTAYLRGLSAPGREPPGPPDAESPDVKRLPLPLTRPRLLCELPALPEYLREPQEQTGLLRGVATHKALSLIPFPPLAECLRAEAPNPSPDPSPALLTAIEAALSRLTRDGRLTPEERERTDARTLARFFHSPIGRRALRAGEVHREWSFNLRPPELGVCVLQGVIDLCFREEAGWTLVDYKTDRVHAADSLWDTYGPQIRLYCRALLAATGVPVREAALFALSLGESSSRAGTLAGAPPPPPAKGASPFGNP